VQWTSESVQRGTEREEGVRKGGADKFTGVRRDIATLVIGVNGDVKSEKLHELLLISESKEIGKIVGVILGGVDGWEFSGTKDVTVDPSSNIGKLSNPINMLVGVYGVHLGTDRSIESSNVGPQYSFFGRPSW
jgi:hypothetical protein